MFRFRTKGSWEKSTRGNGQTAELSRLPDWFLKRYGSRAGMSIANAQNSTKRYASCKQAVRVISLQENHQAFTDFALSYKILTRR
jgi:hypothetical protein